MAIKPEAVGQSTEPLTHNYRWQDVALYALGVGAKRDELDFLFEDRGPQVLPTYAVIPAYEANKDLFDVVGGDMKGVVHGGQTIRLHRPFKPEDTLTTIGKVEGIYDLRRMATSIISTQTTNGAGELVAETEWEIIYRFDGGFGGEPPPRRPKARPPERDPDFVHEERTLPEQALLYRLCGDYNPLHADPKLAEEVGFGAPILHGLCTYGFVGRAVLANCCGSDPSKFKALSGQFRKPVWPGDTLITEGWREDERVILRVSTKERPGEYVVANAWAEVA